ncbi:cytochrome c biogenesis protein ResB [Aeromicrobium stalagmiti]|uniref:cytochrome c biogenesis protein ResB n=1 Tax=Aeromicrobium stalagmiti TaxID=2738988 RepID=UPI001568CD7B|nr:cytochrome c biogenesis protein ResB [Aeromicrobium stalagmiti]NRQ51745.1 cytochrome c biogenesis protein ResB [Aeromicrobium stalagmiti]
MRTALMLLLALALAAIPGSLLPQRGVDARAVETYQLQHPKSAPVLDKLGFFEAYSSPWFSAIYLLLMVSLVGCILPRTTIYVRALRSRPPKVPARMSRLPAYETFDTTVPVSEVMTAARQAVPRARIDIVQDDALGELSAETGYLREAGNLAFHVSVVVVMIGVAGGALLGSRGAAIVTEGDTFSNTLTQFDEFDSGSLFTTDDLVPFSLTLDDFTASFQLDGPQRGAPRMFRAKGTYANSTDTAEKPFDITVNNPLSIGDTSVFLVGHGYAPVIRVTAPNGDVLFDEAVPFLPVDATYTSNGVVKVSTATPEQLGFQGFFLPTAVTVGSKDVSVSAFPAAANPVIGLQVWRGDLGLDDGTPQSVYTFDKTNMRQYMSGDKPLRITLAPGTQATLPDGGTIEFVALKQFARFQIGSAPYVQLPLIGISIGLVGLMLSLSIKPRRIWVRARLAGNRTTVEIGLLDRVSRGDLPADLDDFTGRLRTRLAPLSPTPDSNPLNKENP